MATTVRRPRPSSATRARHGRRQSAKTARRPRSAARRRRADRRARRAEPRKPAPGSGRRHCRRSTPGGVRARRERRVDGRAAACSMPKWSSRRRFLPDSGEAVSPLRLGSRRSSIAANENQLLDLINRRLLQELQADARGHNGRARPAINLSAPAVAERIQRLERAGVITGYRAEVDPREIGLIAAVVRVRPTTRQLQKIPELAREIPEVVDCHRITGEDCFVKLHLRSMDDLEGILDRFIVRRPDDLDHSLRPWPGAPCRWSRTSGISGCSSACRRGAEPRTRRGAGTPQPTKASTTSGSNCLPPCSTRLAARLDPGDRPAVGPAARHRVERVGTAKTRADSGMLVPSIPSG